MTHSEALYFLDLTEDADDEMIAQRFKEKNNFFKTLYNNAPNNVVRNQHEKNLEKLAEIKYILKVDTAPLGRKSQSLGPAMRISSSQMLNDKSSSAPQNGEPVAWLVVHMEDKPIESYGLIEGENPVGRSEVPNRNNILIEDDAYVSRYHCVIIIAPTRGQLAAAVADDGRYNKGKPSVNGTYINGSEARVTLTRIKENDTIQIGITKLVFAWNTSNKKQIEDQVGMTGYVKTVIIKS